METITGGNCSKQNKPFKVNDNGVERVIWDSRSVAVGIYIFAQDENKNWYVLANKRGQGCPDYQGYWCCPCGYLDWGEDEVGASVRETYEETGLMIRRIDVNVYDASASPTFNRQNVTFRLYSVLNNTIDKFIPLLNTNHMEENEVDDLKFIPITDISQYKWAFGHETNIRTIFKTRVKISWWKRIINTLYNKYLYIG